MQNRIRWVLHKGQRILRVDYSTLKGAELLAVIQQVPEFYKDQPKASICCLVDASDAGVDRAALDALKRVIKVTEGIDKKAAVLGITGVKRTILAALNIVSDHALRPFSSEEEALEWLTS